MIESVLILLGIIGGICITMGYLIFRHRDIYVWKK